MLILHVDGHHFPASTAARNGGARASERASTRSHDNARRRGKCRLITLSAISRYKVDGRRALKPPLGPASTSCAWSPTVFAVSHRETLPDLPLTMKLLAALAFRLAGTAGRSRANGYVTRHSNVPLAVSSLSLLHFPNILLQFGLSFVLFSLINYNAQTFLRYPHGSCFSSVLQIRSRHNQLS